MKHNTQNTQKCPYSDIMHFFIFVFVFTTSWISIESPTSNDLANEVKRSEENDKRMFEYYRTGELTGKIALVFKGLYLKQNLIHQFTIFSVKPSEKVVGAKYIYSSEKPVTPYLFVTKNNKSKYYANNLSAPEDQILFHTRRIIFQTHRLGLFHKEVIR